MLLELAMLMMLSSDRPAKERKVHLPPTEVEEAVVGTVVKLKGRDLILRDEEDQAHFYLVPGVRILDSKQAPVTIKALRPGTVVSVSGRFPLEGNPQITLVEILDESK